MKKTKNTKHINFKVATQLTGINANTLRAWERRYEQLRPQKTPQGSRLYSSQDVEKLIILWDLVQKGHLISRIAGLTIAELTNLQRDLAKLTKPPQALATPEREIVERQHQSRILRSLQKFDLAGLQSNLQIARFELSPKSIVHHLVLPLMKEVGDLVAESKIKISQEHLLSSLLRDHLGQIYQSLNPFETRKRLDAAKILLTTREGDLHEFGILLAAILCRIAGHETYYLGPNMPAEDLAAACREFKIDILILGLAQIPKEREFITPSRFLKKIDQLTPRKLQFICGGTNNISFDSLSSERSVIHFKTLLELDKFISSSIKI